MADPQFEDVDIVTPSGEKVTVNVPSGWSDDQIRTNLRMKNPELFQTQEMKANLARNAVPTQFEKDRPGANMTLGQHAWDFLKTTAANLVPGGSPPIPYNTMGAVNPAPFQRMQQNQAQAMQNQRQFRKDAGYSPVYRALAEIAPLAMVNPAGAEQAAAQGRTGAVLGNTVGPPAAIAAASAAIPAVADAIPSKSRAQAGFQSVMAATKDIPIDTAGPGQIALRTQELAQSGGRMPKVVNDFIKRATDPEKGPMTYAEARDFYSNATRMSVKELSNLNPVMLRQVGQFTTELNKSIMQAAAKTGNAAELQSAMNEYSKFMTMQNIAAKAIKAAPYVAGGLAASHEIRKLTR